MECSSAPIMYQILHTLRTGPTRRFSLVPVLHPCRPKFPRLIGANAGAREFAALASDTRFFLLSQQGKVFQSQARTILRQPGGDT